MSYEEEDTCHMTRSLSSSLSPTPCCSLVYWFSLVDWTLLSSLLPTPSTSVAIYICLNIAIYIIHMYMYVYAYVCIIYI
jgi:hypothetical protein